MKFPSAALYFVIGCFIFFVLWAVSSLLLSEVAGAMQPLASKLSTDNYSNMLNMLPWAFGIICAIFFVMALVAIFFMDSLSDEPEIYYR